LAAVDLDAVFLLVEVNFFMILLLFETVVLWSKIHSLKKDFMILVFLWMTREGVKNLIWFVNRDLLLIKQSVQLKKALLVAYDSGGG